MLVTCRRHSRYRGREEGGRDEGGGGGLDESAPLCKPSPVTRQSHYLSNPRTPLESKLTSVMTRKRRVGKRCVCVRGLMCVGVCFKQ